MSKLIVSQISEVVGIGTVYYTTPPGLFWTLVTVVDALHHTVKAVRVFLLLVFDIKKNDKDVNAINGEGYHECCY